MSFKIHLIVVSFIIVVVYVSWQLISKTPVQAPVVPAASKYSISVIHASWGLNCVIHKSDNGNEGYISDTSQRKLQTDNVLVEVSQLCNGKLKCDIPIKAATLGADPAPECNGKALEVEYRCFSYDRPWIARGTSGKLGINCDRSENGG